MSQPYRKPPRPNGVIETLPHIRTRVQLTALVVAVAGVSLIRVSSPDAVRAQIAAGSVGVCLVVFAQVFHFIHQIPARSRLTLVLGLFVAFLLFSIAMGVVITTDLHARDSEPLLPPVSPETLIRQLTLELRSEDPVRRRHAAEQLIAYGADAAPELVKAISDESGEVAALVFEAMTNGKIVSILMEMAKPKPFQTPFLRAATECLVAIGEPAVPAILQQLAAESISAEELLKEAAQRESAQPAQPNLAQNIEQLIFLMNSSAPALRIGIAREAFDGTLFEIGDPAIPHMLRGLDSERILVGHTCLRVLSRLPSAKAPTLDKLQEIAARSASPEKEQIAALIRQFEAGAIN